MCKSFHASLNFTANNMPTHFKQNIQITPYRTSILLNSPQRRTSRLHRQASAINIPLSSLVRSLGSHMALTQLTSTHSQLVTFPIYPPHSPKFPQVSTVLSILLHRQRSMAQTLSMASVRRRSGGAAARASPPQQQQVEEERAGREDRKGSEWGKVSAVLFDMDGVLCNSEEPSRMAAVDVFAEMGVSVTVDDFVPFMGTGTLLLLLS